ncbi:CHAT domain-containing protein [Larkinella terrae]|uniref:CHAT domain-containing protein n=1 Tax=Larkinella terrae TaxID=2025311 RepID=UPI0014788268|nr:CHAT domain-containing protein [Larkinella terrae]
MFIPALAQAQIDPKLLTALRQNSLAGVQAALKTGVNPNATDSLGATPLMWACFHADTSVVKLLLRNGAKTECRGIISTENSSDYSSLTGLAAGRNKLPLLRYLVDTLKLAINETGYSPATLKKANWTPAEWAAANGHLDVLRYLTERGADLRVGQGNAMVLALLQDQPAILRFLLEHGVGIDNENPALGQLWQGYFLHLSSAIMFFKERGQDRPVVLATEQMRTIFGKYVGKQNIIYAGLVKSVALSYYNVGEYERALPPFLEARDVLKQVLGESHPDYAYTLNNLGGLYTELGQDEKALPLLLQSISIYVAAPDKNLQDYASSLNNLAAFYQYKGQYEQALPLLLESSEIIKRALGDNHPDYAHSLNNLAETYRCMGQYDKALSLFLQAKTILAVAPVTYQRDYAALLSNLAILYWNKNQNDQALPLLLQASDIWKKVLGENHPNFAVSRNNLALFYMAMGEYEQSLPLFLEAQAIVKQMLGNAHPVYATLLINLAELYDAIGQFEQAAAFYLEARQQYRGQLLSQIGVMNETAIGQFQQKADYKNVVYSLSQTTSSQTLAGQHYNDALLGSGVGLLAGQQLNRLVARTTDTTARRIAIQLRDAKQYLIRLQSLPASQIRRIDSLRNRVAGLEEQLVLALPEYAKSFNSLRLEWPQIRQALKPDEAAIEFVSFRYFHKRWTDSTFYLALVLRPGFVQPKIVFLGEQRQFDQLLAAGTASPTQINSLYRGGVVESGPGAVQVTRGLDLSRLIWQPLDSLLQGVKTVFVSPSGRLHQIALGALPNPADSSQCIADRFQIRQVGSTRIVALRNAKTEQPLVKKTLKTSLYGGISYDADSLGLIRQIKQKEVQHQLALREATRSGTWDYLPGTQAEVENLRRILPPGQTTVLTRETATEGSLKALAGRSPKILHVATHGFFFPDLSAPKTDQFAFISDGPNRFQFAENPLLRSGLVMAGANYVWKGGTPIDGIDDGILTAYELSNLDLSNTELVVLSACETGLGQVKGSEGVYGLQRAVKMAGARYLLMSLWRVADRETAEYMTLFYRRLLKKGSVPAAYAYAQNHMRARYPKEPFKWAAFVLVE